MSISKNLHLIPVDNLVRIVQDPHYASTVGIPAYAALGEIQKRKAMQQEGGQAQGAPAPTATVKDQIMAQTQPGLPTLPVRDDMYNEASYASGGIVAFDDGGSVDEAARRWSRLGDYDPYYGYPIDAPGLSPSDVAYASALRDSGSSDMLGRIGTAFRDYAAAPGEYLKSVGHSIYDMTYGNTPVWDPKLGKMVKQRDIDARVAATPVPATSKADADAAFKAEGVAGLKKRQDYLAANPSVNPATEVSRRDKTAAFLAADAEKNKNDPYFKAQQMAYDAKRRIQADVAAGKYSRAGAGKGDVDLRPAAPASVVGTSNAPGTTRDFSSLAWKNLSDRSADYDAMLAANPKRTAQEAMAEYKGLVGEDEGLALLKDRLANMESKAAKESERAPWMALAKAGLAMAGGKSPYALQNVAAGGIEGLKDYAEAKKDLEQSEQKRFAIQAQMAQAERAEKVAAAKYGLESEQADRLRAEQNRLAKLGYQTSLESANAKGNLEAAQAQVTAGQKERELSINEKHFNDWFKVSMDKAAKDLQGLSKAELAQQTALVNTNLTQAQKELSDAVKMGDKNAVANAKQYVQYYQGLSNMLLEKQGFKVPPLPTAPAGGGALMQDKSGNYVYQPR